MSSDRLPGIDALIAQARSQQLDWNGLAELVLRQEHAAGAHQPDTDRARRCGFGEVIYGSGKSPADVTQIATELLSQDAVPGSGAQLAGGRGEVLVTRVTDAEAAIISEAFPFSRHDSQARTLRLSQTAEPAGTLIHRDQMDSEAGEKNDRPALPRSCVAVVTAGSTDIHVAREAVETLHWMGVPVSLTTDVGVAGPYRLLAHIEHLRQCVAVVVVAGMEGALSSVVGGLVPCPVIAVPTSVGYGANFEGITTLLSMLSSCAAGVTAVNIDAGFKGGYVAGLIAAQHIQARTTSSAAQ